MTRAILHGGQRDGEVVDPFSFIGQYLVTPEGDRYGIDHFEGNTSDEPDTYHYRYEEPVSSKEGDADV